MKNKNMFITINGVDGVGKTTVAKLLASDGFRYYKSPAATGPFAQLRKEVDKHATPLERYCFHQLSIQYDYRQIGMLLEMEDTSIVCDCCVSSTFAYHVALDDRIRSIHNYDYLLKPDFAFILGAHSDVRDLKRGVFSDRKLNNSAFINETAGIFMLLRITYFYINTSNITAIQTAEEIRNIIKIRT